MSDPEMTTFGMYPEPEPVAWISHNAGLYHGKPDESLNPLPLYTAPPQREWQGLTDEDCKEVERWIDFKEDGSGRIATLKLIRYIESKLKAKNHD